ncbi:MAG: hypothetical protein HC769_18545 [Cyanobacteria bacterium CRU_2_1]|nr:hypothetical protein [Cyanobacteria bacterium CRU_2_1]
MDLDLQLTERIPLELPNGRTVQVEVSPTGRSDVAFDRMAFKEVTNTIEGVIDSIAATIYKTMPTKATVKFGIDVGVESGSLTAVIVKGSSKANLEITLEWDRSSSNSIDPK